MPDTIHQPVQYPLSYKLDGGRTLHLDEGLRMHPSSAFVDDPLQRDHRHAEFTLYDRAGRIVHRVRMHGMDALQLIESGAVADGTPMHRSLLGEMPAAA